MELNLKQDADQPIQIRPTTNRILVKPISPEQRTSAGLIIPEVVSDKNRPNIGVVVDVGEFNETVPSDHVNKGDFIFFGKYTGTEIKVNNELHLIMRVQDVLARITNLTEDQISVIS